MSGYMSFRVCALMCACVCLHVLDSGKWAEVVCGCVLTDGVRGGDVVLPVAGQSLPHKAHRQRDDHTIGVDLQCSSRMRRPGQAWDTRVGSVARWALGGGG